MAISYQSRWASGSAWCHLSEYHHSESGCESQGRNRARWPLPGPTGSEGEESACNAGDLGLMPGLGKSPGEGKGNPLQYSCLENPMGRGTWRATVHGVTESWLDWVTNTFTFFIFLCQQLPVPGPQLCPHEMVGLNYVVSKVPLGFYHLRGLWCSLPLMERSPKSIAGDPAHMSLFWKRRV